MSAKIACLTLAVALLAGGCVTREVVHEPGPTQTVYVPIAPPAAPPVAEIVPLQPGANYAWHPGHYVWNGSAYAWAAGEWVERPAQVAAWEPGHWDHGANGWVWIEGRWR